ncbi:MAG: hypothetical protein ACFFF9_17475 [Candidatus Thorarchaeota archaeon]
MASANRGGNYRFTELTETEVVFIDKGKTDSGFFRYDTSKESTLEFFDYEPDGSRNFSLLIEKVLGRFVYHNQEQLILTHSSEQFRMSN